MAEQLDAVDRLRRSAEGLNALTDRAMETVVGLETLFQSNGVGVCASVPVSVPTDGGTSVTQSLGYQRYGERFRIVGLDKDGNARPWAELNRHEKLYSFRALPNLILALDDAVTKTIQLHEAATVAVVRAFEPFMKRKDTAT